MAGDPHRRRNLLPATFGRDMLLLAGILGFMLLLVLLDEQGMLRQ